MTVLRRCCDGVATVTTVIHVKSNKHVKASKTKVKKEVQLDLYIRVGADVILFAVA